jgi:hypothetical protein
MIKIIDFCWLKQSLPAVVLAGALSLFGTGAVYGATILNGSFDAVGPDGASPPANDFNSAALDWFVFQPDAGSTVTTVLLPTTDPFGGGNMLGFTTDQGFNGSSANGLFGSTDVVLPAGSTVTIDIDPSPGTSGEVGFVVGGGFSAGTATFGPTTGWQQVTFQNNSGASDELGFEVDSNNGGQLYVDNAVLAAPEPGSLLLFGTALAGLGLLRRRR